MDACLAQRDMSSNGGMDALLKELNRFLPPEEAEPIYAILQDVVLPAPG